MTRNTRLYKLYNNNQEILIRDLTTAEINVLNNIKNINLKYEMAAKFAVLNCDPLELHWTVLYQIGVYIINKSQDILYGSVIRDITINDIRNKVKEDDFYILISQIIHAFPGESILKLMDMTYRDLVELVCFIEITNNKNILKTSSNKPIKKSNGKNEFPDDGLSLAEKIRLNAQQ